MELFERVWNVIKHDHKQIWLLLSTNPSPLQDIVLVQGAMTSATIQNAPEMAVMVGKRNRQHFVLMEHTVLCVIKLSCKYFFGRWLLLCPQIWNTLRTFPCSIFFVRTIFLGTLIQLRLQVKNHLCYYNLWNSLIIWLIYHNFHFSPHLFNSCRPSWLFCCGICSI